MIWWSSPGEGWLTTLGAASGHLAIAVVVVVLRMKLVLLAAGFCDGVVSCVMLQEHVSDIDL